MDDPPVRPLTPPGEVAEQRAVARRLRQGAASASEIVQAVRAGLADRYEVECEIGRGGDGPVRLGHCYTVW